MAANPEAGELKIGDLQDFRVYKFKMNRQVILMAYKIQNDSLIFYLAGSHQNFYKNLKKYLREIGEQH
ncbi:type II toxin-antitoxin system RelE/ParE family toxin [Desulfonema magnum]|uniref:type II toxin-antitoxin system RelE/ParE family toxin n=1 Tax=Desulfonema magnum TaxID=45655 RepID=UPI001A9B6A0A